MTHYETLGIESLANETEIRAAFRKLATQNHPDRFEGELRAQAEIRFQSITEAFNILSRPGNREKYDQEIAQGPRSVGGRDPKEIARLLAAKGAQAYKDGKATDAISLLRQALDHDSDQARAHYFLGMVLARVPGKARDSLRHLERATALEPENLVMKAEAAGAYLDSGMGSRAERLALEILEIDPTNTKATNVLEQARTGGSSTVSQRKG